MNEKRFGNQHDLFFKRAFHFLENYEIGFRETVRRQLNQKITAEIRKVEPLNKNESSPSQRRDFRIVCEQGKRLPLNRVINLQFFITIRTRTKSSHESEFSTRFSRGFNALVRMSNFRDIKCLDGHSGRTSWKPVTTLTFHLSLVSPSAEFRWHNAIGR